MAKRKKNYNKKYERKSGASQTGMFSERFREAVLRYTVLLFLVMLIGLINKDQWGMRGFPFVWFVNSRFIIMDEFIRSLECNLFIIVVTDILTRVFILAREPEVITASNAYTAGTENLTENDTSETIETFDINEISGRRKKTNEQISPLRMFALIMSITTSLLVLIFALMVFLL